MLLIYGCGGPDPSVSPALNSSQLELRLSEPRLRGGSLEVQWAGQTALEIAVPEAGDVSLPVPAGIRQVSVRLKAPSGAVAAIAQTELDPARENRLEIPAGTPPPPPPATPIPDAPAFQARRARPNVVLIVLDDLDFYDLGCYGSPTNKTPRLDQLAAQGMRFRSFYGSPICTPSRIGLLSSHSPTALGVHQLEPYVTTDGRKLKSARGIPAVMPGLGQIFKDLGYGTAMIGKWHVGEARPEFRCPNKGFKTKIEMNVVNGFYWGYQLAVGGERIQMPLRGQPGADDHYATLELTNRALDYIDKNKSNPFFVYVAYTAIHDGLHVPPAFDNTGLNFDLTTPQGMTSAMLYDVDREIGRIVDLVDSLGLSQDTLFLVVSDNGGIPVGRDSSFRGGAIRGFKGDTYDGGIRVPMLARCPGTVPRLAINDSLCSNLDLLPTLASFIGTTPPPGIQGQDLCNTLTTGQTLANPRDLFWCFRGQQLRLANTAEYDRRDIWAVRSGKYKLVYGADQKMGLYDVSSPTGEFTDLSATNPALVSNLQAKWKAWHATVARLDYTLVSKPSVVQIPFDTRLDFVEGEWTFTIDASANNLTQNRVLASRAGCWELAWIGDHVRLTLYDDKPGSLQERACIMTSQALTANERHRITFTIYGQGWAANRIVSIYVDGKLHKRRYPGGYPGSQTFRATAPSDEPVTVGSSPTGTKAFDGTIYGPPEVHSQALSMDEL